MIRRPPADQAERTRAIEERARNVIVDAGAGTGKTTLLVRRLLHLVAPADDGPALSLSRIAAITFTRKAAGELKLRLREALLAEAARTDVPATRGARVRDALEQLDNAPIGTVHSFADRLLRLRPADAKLSPAYEIAEDPAPLVEETYRSLLDAAEQGTLGALLAGTLAEPYVEEATETLRMFQAAGLKLRSESFEFGDRLGLDALVSDLVESRDRPLQVPTMPSVDLDTVRRCAAELTRVLRDVSGTGAGARTLRRLERQAPRIAEARDTPEALRRAIEWYRDVDRAKKSLRKGEHFEEDAAAWTAFQWLTVGTRGARRSKEERPGGALALELVSPLTSYMTARLVRLRPVILARYAQVKRAHERVDQIDLLQRLRDLLAHDLGVRAFYQARFDHLMVDEFQDTDPLQAEIVLYLAEDGAFARSLDVLTLAPGKLTIVGDPKQSIYRFRRADVATYADVCTRLRRAPVCEAQLTVNFRSAEGILHFVNDAFDALLGAASEGPRYEPDRGAVRNVRLVPCGIASQGPAVHVLPFGDDALNAEEARDLEGEALAHYLRFLVEDGEVRVRDPRTGELRRPRYGDIAVTMVATQTVHHLTSELDRIGVPHVVRGGTLFMEDPLHRQFVLGLRALSDRRDGAARAALMRPPFFAVELADLLRERCDEPAGPALEAATAVVDGLRRTRHLTTPGETARRVLEQTGFGSYVAAGVNGAQRLARLYELCLALDAEARASGLDFDAVTRLARGWIDAPARIEAPLPVDADAVQVITTHQAKGLEWPIVALWDARAALSAFLPPVALTVDALRGQWALKLDGLPPDEAGKELLDRERALRTEERKRVAYVAATRARDLLIVPEAGTPREQSIAGALVRGGERAPHLRVPRYRGSGSAWWHSETGVSMRPLAPAMDDLEAAFARAAERARAPHHAPAGVTTTSHRSADAVEICLAPAARPRRVGRHGPVFGSTVHRALALVLSGSAGNADGATRRAAREEGLLERLPEAVEDVNRTLVALARAGLRDRPRRVEVPIAGALAADTLLAGYIDLLVSTDDALVVIDFKTDEPPGADVRVAYPEYVAQVETYRRLLAASELAGPRALRAGLLFTADGSLHWL